VKWLYLCLAAAWQCAQAAEGVPEYSLIDNASPRRDVQGDIIDAHDGNLRYFQGRYYLYGVSYGNTDGFTGTNRYVVYSSSDLMSWRNDGVIMRDIPNGTYFRPKVVFNKSRHQFILWYNWWDKTGRFGVAEADSPYGPFRIVNSDVKLRHSGAATADFYVFVDDDDKAYIIYISEGPTRITPEEFQSSVEPKGAVNYLQVYIEELTGDYLGGTGKSVGPLAGNIDAPVLFKRGRIYYALFDNTCSFCAAGSGVRVYTSRNPLGPFEYRGNINRLGFSGRGSPSPWTSPGTGRPDALIKAQQSDVAIIPGAEGAPTYLWLADRWKSAPDGQKGHDFQHWAVLSFSPDGMINTLVNRETWSIKVTTPPSSTPE